MSRQSLLDKYFKSKSNTTSKMEQLSDTSRKRPGLEVLTPTATKAKRTLENSAEDEIIVLSSDDEDNSAKCAPNNQSIKSTPPLNELSEPLVMNNDNAMSMSKNNPSLLNLSLPSNSEPEIIKKEGTLTTPKKKCTMPNELSKPLVLKNDGELITPEENFSLLDLTPQSEDDLCELKIVENISPIASQKKQSGSFNLTQSNAHIDDVISIKNESILTTPNKKPTPTKRLQVKHFSPSKKCLVMNGNKKNSPAKKKFAQKLFQSEDTSEDLDSSQDDNMIDDKSLILLINIKNLVNDTSLFNLLDEGSQNILKECLHVEYPGLHLVCRLYWRLHIWYRLKTLLNICKKKNIDSRALDLILDSLVEKGILVQSSSEGTNNATFGELTQILNIDELKQVCKDLKIKIQSKESAVKSLKKYCRQIPISSYLNGGCVITNKDRVMNKMREKAGICYKLSDTAKAALHKLYLLMYLGIQYSVIREKKLEWLIIYDKIKTETFPIDKTMILDNASCVFSSRQEFESYVEAHLVYENFLAETESCERCEIVKTVYNSYQNIKDEDMRRYMSYPEWLYKYTPPHIYIKILDKGVQDLKRQKDPECYLLALEILTSLIKQKTFKQQNVGDWYAEKALILHTYLRRHDEAALILIEGFKSVTSDVAKEIMQPRAIKISGQQNTYITEELRKELQDHATKDSKLEKDLPCEFVYKQPMTNDGNRGSKIKFIVQTDNEKQYMNVEDYCVYHCKTDGGYTHAEHWEGKVIKSIFCLLFWDIIYTKPRGISGIFLTYYQRYPMDMYYKSFYYNRKILINDRLSKIAQYTEEQLLDEMKNTWLKRPDYELSDVDRKIGWENISMVAACLGPEKVAVICKRLASNYGYSVNGFPDVTAWNSTTKRIKFLEVKSDSDKPSIKQIQWMHYLHNNGIDTGFFYVGANPHRNKSRAAQIHEECEVDDDEIL